MPGRQDCVLQGGRLAGAVAWEPGWGAVRQLRGVMDSDGCADMAGTPALGTMWAVPCPQQVGKEEQTPGRWYPSHSCCALDHALGSSRPPASNMIWVP